MAQGVLLISPDEVARNRGALENKLRPEVFLSAPLLCLKNLHGIRQPTPSQVTFLTLLPVNRGGNPHGCQAKASFSSTSMPARRSNPATVLSFSREASNSTRMVWSLPLN